MAKKETLPDRVDTGGGAYVVGDVSVEGCFVGRDKMVTDGGELFGDSSIPPTLYHCPSHGDVLAQDVVWKQDGHPYCPDCDALLDK